MPINKDLVRSKTITAIYKGELVRKPCTVCGELKVDAHHPDYNKPLEVIWLCRKHHNQLHFPDKEKNDNRVDLKLRLEEKDHKALKVKTAQQRVSIQEVLEQAVRQFLTSPRSNSEAKEGFRY